MKKYFITIMLAVFALLANAQQQGTQDGIYHFDWNQYAYPNNMHVTLTIRLDNVLQENENLEIGFFYNNECRGREILSGEYYDFTGYYTAAVTINGSNGMGIGDFRLYNHSTNQELNVTCSHAAITFTADQDLGDYFNPEEFAFTTVPDPITITTVANPTDGGVTTGSGTYEAGNSCTITATANEGYEFVNWKQGANVITTNAAYTFTVTESATYTANFSLLSFDITVTADPTEGGTVSGGGSFEYNTETYLSATANDGYIFQNWTLDSEVISNVATFPITVTEDAEYVAHFIPESYVITATADPTVGGTVTGGGEYDYGTQCTLTATPETGYHFVNWTLSGTEVSTDAEYTFSVSGAGDYVAHFAINNYTITATANPTEGGTVSGAGTYDHFSTCTLTATPATGYHFINWTLSGTEVSTDAEYTFTVSNEGDYVANFELNNYTISATVNPTEAGTITGAGNYDHFSTCTLTVTPNYGYTFVNWTLNGNAVGTETTISFTVTGEAAYVANFTPTSYTINATADPTEGGTVSGAGSHNYNTTCTLTATANTGYTFVNWTCGSTVVSTDPTYSFTVTGDTTYVAHFSLNNYAITATTNPSGAGTITGAGNYDHFSTCTLTVTPNYGYNFVNWTLNGNAVGTETTISFTVTGEAAYVANFTPTSYTINATADPTEGGTVSGAGSHNYNTTCTLTATANTGYTFVNWTCGSTVVSTDPTYSFTVTGDTTYVAHFSLNNYAITVTANPAAGGTVTGAGNYDHGATVTLNASANDGYAFINWTLNNEEVSTNASYSFTATADAAYVANFGQDTCVIAAVADPIEGGIIEGAGTYDLGATVTLTATPNAGYEFVNWTLDSTVVATTATYSFNAMVDASYVAHFALIDYTITATADPAVGGTISGAGEYHLGDICTLIATPNVHYTFVNWTLNGEEVSTNANFSFPVSGNANYVAHFVQVYHVNAFCTPEGSGNLFGMGTYVVNDLCTLSATARPGHVFMKWTTEDGTLVTSSHSFSFTVTEDVTYIAVFIVNEHEITVSASPAQGGTVDGGGIYSHGQTATITAMPNDGYVFVNWLKNGVVVSEEPEYSFHVLHNAAYTATFAPLSFQILASVDPTEGGSITGTGTYFFGETATLNVVLNDNYIFDNWTEDGQVVSTNQIYSFVVTGDRTLVAHAHYYDGISEHNITVSVYPSPVSDKLTIMTSIAGCTLEVYSITGAKVYSENDCSDKVELQVSDLPAGTYVIRLISNDSVQTTRFVKE